MSALQLPSSTQDNIDSASADATVTETIPTSEPAPLAPPNPTMPHLPSTSATTSLKLLKSALRKRVTASLSNIPASSLQQQSQAMTRALTALPEYTTAQRISLFLSKDSGEIQTKYLLEKAWEDGKRVYVPHIIPAPETLPLLEGDPFKKPRRIMTMLRLHDRADLGGLEKDSWGIPCFSEGAEKGREECLPWEVDLLVMPGAVFDKAGGRLGYGGGFYDYFLWRARTGRVPRRVGIALEEQLVEEGIPMGERDWRVEKLVMGSGEFLEFGEGEHVEA